MLSDEELIDGLRSAVATLHPRSDLLDCLSERAAAEQPRDHRPFTARVADALVEPRAGELPTAQAPAPADELPRN